MLMMPFKFVSSAAAAAFALLIRFPRKRFQGIIIIPPSAIGPVYIQFPSKSTEPSIANILLLCWL
jgi:hypothetical protein